MTSHNVEPRRRGSVWARGNSLQVRVFSGADPVTGRDLYLTSTVRGTDRAAHREAQKELTRLLRQMDEQRTPNSTVSLGHALDEWLRTAELEDTTPPVSCGHVGCRPDSSLKRHDRAHFRAEGHPLIRSFEPGED